MALDCTIIIPHKPTIHNDRALELNLHALLKHTKVQYELIIDTTTPANPYGIWMRAAQTAHAETLVFTNSDVIMGPGWDVLVRHVEPNTIVTGYIIEPGNIGVADVNIQLDFGKMPKTFQSFDFDRWVLKRLGFIGNGNEVKIERGWYMPSAMNRAWFLSTPGFDLDYPFPNPADIRFWEYCIKEYGTQLLRVPSYSYHFQNLSNTEKYPE